MSGGSPAGSTTLTILRDKQDCDRYSRFDARLFAQCMETRGYAVAVYGPDNKRTTIEKLYTPKSAAETEAQPPLIVRAPQADFPDPPQAAARPAPPESSSAILRVKRLTIKVVKN